MLVLVYHQYYFRWISIDLYKIFIYCILWVYGAIFNKLHLRHVYTMYMYVLCDYFIALCLMLYVHVLYIIFADDL